MKFLSGLKHSCSNEFPGVKLRQFTTFNLGEYRVLFGVGELTENFGPLCRRPPVGVVFWEFISGPKSVQDYFINGEFVWLAGLPGGFSGARCRPRHCRHTECQTHTRRESHTDTGTTTWLQRDRRAIDAAGALCWFALTLQLDPARLLAAWCVTRCVDLHRRSDVTDTPQRSDYSTRRMAGWLRVLHLCNIDIINDWLIWIDISEESFLEIDIWI